METASFYLVKERNKEKIGEDRRETVGDLDLFYLFFWSRNMEDRIFDKMGFKNLFKIPTVTK